MKKLTELDLQNALDECELMRFRTHGDWLAGMVRRLNATLTNEPATQFGALKTIVTTGNAIEPTVPCIS